MQCLLHLKSLIVILVIEYQTLFEGMNELIALKSFDIAKCPRIEVLPNGLVQRLSILEGFIILMSTQRWWDNANVEGQNQVDSRVRM